MKSRNRKLTIRRVIRGLRYRMNIRGLRYRMNSLEQYLAVKQFFRHTFLYRTILLTFSSLFVNTNKYQNSIDPEVNNEFAAAIKRVFRQSRICTVIEVGASSGLGSTQLIIDCLQEYSKNAKIAVHLIEVSPVRALMLSDTYRDLVFVTVHNKSTVSPSEHMTPLELLNFNRDNDTKMRNRMMFMPMRWLREDIKFLKENPYLWNPSAFQDIKIELNPSEVDFALIDGGFCGLQDTKNVLGAKYIALDDVDNVKNFLSFKLLKESPIYELVECNYEYRNGYAIFRKI